jgi:type IV pilus assembly protein PilV
MKHLSHRQSGASLIEVLVAVLVLSFGMLALGGMLAYAVQLPKLSGYRSTAVTLAAGHIERMRANTSGFVGESYKETMTYNTTLPTVTPCTYPSCTATEIATLDKDEANRALRRELPLGGMRMVCNGACTAMEGDLWVLWQEPTTFAALSAATSDECPVSSVDAPFTISGTQPRCLHIRFKL